MANVTVLNNDSSISGLTLALTATSVTTSSTGTVNDFAPGAYPYGDIYVRCTNSSDLIITGIVAGAYGGQRIHFAALGAGNVFFVNQSASSSTNNRLINYATSGNTPLAGTYGTATYIYDATNLRWRLITHEQGAWITPIYSSGFYTGNGAMTWTVASGDVATQAYRLDGKTVSVAWALNTTTVGGTPNNSLQIGNGAWGSFTATKTMYNGLGQFSNNGVPATGTVTILAAGVTLIINLTNGGAFTASTDNTQVTGQISFEVN